MCGIAGAVQREPDPAIGAAVVAATRALAHRGPDDEGFWRLGPDGPELCPPERLAEGGRVLFGHRRLSIVDVAGGAQPMANEDGRVWISFNGEVYNQLELRRELERAGHIFRTRADTEVIVHGWEEWGEGVFGRLNGIFALALFDGVSGEVVLARDSLGVKPLYVGTTGAATWWASELGAARAAGLVRRGAAADALALYLTFRFVPSPYGVLESTWKVPPAHLVRLRPDGAGAVPHFRRYDCVVRSAAAPIGRAEWREAVLEGLEQAVRRQLMSDVPVASLLSGGVDSTLVTQAMARALPEPPQAFAIGLESDGAAAETEAARISAAAIGVPLHTVLLDDDRYVAAWPAACRELGEPIGNSGALMLRSLCAEAGRTHKVVLTGQGADEPLGGYPRHMAERLFGLGRHLPAFARRGAAVLGGADAAQRVVRLLDTRNRLDRYVEIFSVMSEREVAALVPGTSAAPRELARAVVARWADVEPPSDTVNELLRIDARLSLADDLLLVADHLSMRSSVELRVPFLDLELVELLERMPSRYKISPLGSRKWLYRQGALRRLPPEARRGLRRTGSPLARKRGFSTPLDRWFAAEDGILARDEEWVGPLAALPELDVDALTETLQRSEANSRVRSVLYTLSMWADAGARPHADAEPAPAR